MASETHENTEKAIAQHYTHGSLLPTILDALKGTGIDVDHLSSDDLASIDEFHTGGRAATVDLAAQMNVVPGMRLLDVGSGIGGPARFFAHHYGCHVTGIDLSAEFCETAEALSARTSLDGRVDYRRASATSLPLDNDTFDGAYMLHVGMNIPGKGSAFREIARVLKPGGVFGIFDIMREADGDLAFPLPWAATSDTSFVETATSYTQLLRDAGFETEKQRSRRDFAIAFFTRMREVVAAAAASGGPPPIGPQLIMGPSAPVKVGNLMSMIQRGLLSPTEIVSRKS